MGLRFRKSITLCKGVRLNFGKTGMSISAGGKGFRQTYNFNTGKKTTTVGIPGTGIYYTTTDGGKKKESKTNKTPLDYSSYDNSVPTYNQPPVTPIIQASPEIRVETKIVEVPVPTKKEKLTYNDIKNIFRVADEKINWFEILSSHTPIDNFFNKEAWSYLNRIALDICQGNIDAYLKVIQDINPYEDLLDYASDFNFGTDESTEMHISFKVVSELINTDDKDLYEDFVCGCVIRVARDTFALLPVEKVFVEVSDETNTLFECCFEKNTFEKIKFSYSDPSDIVNKFKLWR